MGQLPLASVIIPVYNRAHLIERCLDSVAAQGYRPLEVIVVDNNSTDNSLETIAEWINHNGNKGITFKTIECKRPGAASARAYGEQHSNGEYLFFFDSDDAMRSDYVEAAMKVFIDNPDTDIVGWRIKFHYLNGNERKSHIWRPERSIDNHLVNAIFRTQGYAVRRETLNKAGNWNPEVMVWDDWELGIRLLLTEPKIRVIDHISADVYCQEESITGTGFAPKAGKWEEILDLVERIILSSQHLDKLHMARVVVYRRAILAALYKREGHPELAFPLMKKALASPLLDRKGRLALKFAYYYTAAGGRGAFRIIGRLL